MRGDAERQTNMLLAVTPDSLVPADHPIRRIKPIVDAAQVVTEPAWGDRVVLPRRRARRVRGVGQRHREKAADQLDRQQLQEGARRHLTRRGGREEAVDPSRLRGGEHRHGRGPVRAEIIRAQRRQPVRIPQSNGGVGDEGSRDDRASARAVAGVDLEPLRLGGQRHRPAPTHRVAEGGPGPLRRRKLCREVGQDQGHQPALAAGVRWEGVEETGRSHGPSIDRAHRAPLQVVGFVSLRSSAHLASRSPRAAEVGRGVRCLLGLDRAREQLRQHIAADEEVRRTVRAVLQVAEHTLVGPPSG